MIPENKECGKDISGDWVVAKGYHPSIDGK
jgi:hypothetical protein